MNIAVLVAQFTLPSFCKWEDMTESKLPNWICVACSIGCTFLKAWALLAWMTFIFLQCFLEDLICLLQNSMINLPCLNTICMYTQYRELMLDYMSPVNKTTCTCPLDWYFLSSWADRMLWSESEQGVRFNLVNSIMFTDQLQPVVLISGGDEWVGDPNCCLFTSQLIMEPSTKS
jgi:hypothetical protein